MSVRLFAMVAVIGAVVLVVAALVNLNRATVTSDEAVEPTPIEATNESRSTTRSLDSRINAALNTQQRIEVVLTHEASAGSSVRTQIHELKGRIVREYKALNMMRVQLPTSAVEVLRRDVRVVEFAEEYPLF